MPIPPTLLGQLSSQEARELAIHVREWRELANWAGDHAAYPYCFPLLEMAGEFSSLYFEALHQMYSAMSAEVAEFLKGESNGTQVHPIR